MGLSEMIPREAKVGGHREQHPFLKQVPPGDVGGTGENRVKTLVWVKKPTAPKSRCELSSQHMNTLWQVGGGQITRGGVKAGPRAGATLPVLLGGARRR